MAAALSWVACSGMRTVPSDNTDSFGQLVQASGQQRIRSAIKGLQRAESHFQNHIILSVRYDRVETEAKGNVWIPDMISQLFLQWAQALGLPLLALAVSVATYFSGRWQVRIAREKLRHDLYDRRFAVYMAFHELFVAMVGSKGNDNIEIALQKANAARFQSPFLLDGLQAYLAELHKEAFRISRAWNNILDPNVRAARTNQELVQEGMELSQDGLRFADRIAEVSQKFEPFLKLKDFSKGEGHRNRKR